MSCANCSHTISDAVSPLDGVSEANINFATDEAQITYNPVKANLQDLYESIEDSGYSPVREDAEAGDGSEGDI